MKPNGISNIVNMKSLHGDPEEDSTLLQSFHYICGLPGKQIRTKLAVAFNHWLQVDLEIVKKISDVAELLHNASLLIDDIQDGSHLRRGQPVAHAIYGVPQTINAGNYAYFMALERVIELKKPEAVTIFTEQMLDLHRGQGMEIIWRDTFQCPTELQFRQTIVKKTGGLFMLAIRLLQLFSTDQQDYKNLVSLLGLYFQIRDDYANLKLASYSANKSFGEDITEGKFSFPIIHGIHSRPGDTQLLHILKQRTNDLDLKRYFVGQLEKHGSMSYTENAMKSLEAEIRAEIGGLGGNPLLERVLDELAIKSSDTIKNDDIGNAKQ